MTNSTGWNLPWEGGCRCGKVRLRVTQAPLLSTACHCTGCQRMSSSAFSLSLVLPAGGLQVLTGEPVRGGLRAAAKHMFCGHCMTWIFTRIDGLDTIVNLRPTMLDDCTWFVPFIETYTDEMLPWAKTPAVRAFAKFPDVSEYEALIRDFAASAARPRTISS